MGFFDRNRKELVARGLDPSRLPPGQYLTDRFPVLHVGDVPDYGPGQWDLTITGLVDRPFTVDLEQLRAMPSVSLTFDIHCVTKWSKFDTTWTGVRVRDLLERAGVQAGATHVIEHAVKGMLPKNSLGRQMLGKLKLYASAEHPHQAQSPVALPSTF